MNDLSGLWDSRYVVPRAARLEGRDDRLVSKLLTSKVQMIDGVWHISVVPALGGRGWRILRSRPAGLDAGTWVGRRR